MKYILTCFVLLFSPLVFSEDLHSTLQNTIINFAKNNQISAIALTLQLPDNKDLIHVEYGTYAKDSFKKINLSSLFQVGSVTKSFIAAIILQLERDKKIQLEDQIGKWFPEYPRWSVITIKQLLNQTSGLHDYSDTEHWWQKLSPQKQWQAKELLDIAYHEKSYFLPGKSWHYSNTNYVLLGLVIEQVTHQSLEKVLKDFLMKNNLKDTFYVPGYYSELIKSRLVHGYYKYENDMTNITPSWLQGSGSLVSNPKDMTQWYDLLFSGKVLSEKQLKQMTSFVSVKTGKPIKNAAETSYGMGIFSMNTPYGVIWFTPGLTPGYVSLVMWMPCTGITLSYSITNAGGISHLHITFLNKILQIISVSSEFKEKNEYYQSSLLTKNVCNITPAKQFNFPNF